MTNYAVENWERFQKTGVEPDDIKVMKKEAVVNAFKETKKDFEHLVEQIADGIKNKHWTAILGDDVSGRLPALVIGGLASRYALEHDKKPPKQIFFAGGGVTYDGISDDRDGQEVVQEQQQKLEEYIHQQAGNLGERVLIVTEHVMSGRTFLRIANALNKEGKAFDIATLWASKAVSDYKRIFAYENGPELFEDTKWYVGKENAGASGFFGTEISSLLYNLGNPINEASGIKKVGTEPIVKLNEDADRDLVILARQKVNELVDELYSKYLKKSSLGKKFVAVQELPKHLSLRV